uniref:Uncharacterized protein n=1 Tax=Bracon brevicornis TaxID=1563983 RepID=A0A6V7M798_9HYME
MFFVILYQLFAILALSSGRSLNPNDDNEQYVYIRYPLSKLPQSSSGSATSRTALHTEATEDKTLDSNSFGTTLEEFSQRSTSRISDMSAEVTDEASRTIAEERVDGFADVVHANGLRTQYAVKSPEGVSDSYVKEELNGVYGFDEPNGDSHMFGVTENKEMESVSNPYGLDEVIILNEDSDFQASDTSGGIKSTGNTDTDFTYAAGKGDDVETLYLINQRENIQKASDQNGLFQSNIKTDIVGIGYADEVSETMDFSQNEQTTSLNQDGIEASVGVTKKIGQYDAMDWDGNEEMLVSGATNHNVEVKDGDLAVALNKNNAIDVQAAKDEDGYTSVYQGDRGDHTLRISDGDLTAVLGKDGSKMIFGFYNADGSHDLYQITEAGKTSLVADKDNGVMSSKTQVDWLDGNIDAVGAVKDVHSSNQVDNTLIVANDQGGQGVKASTIDEVFEVSDSQGNVGIIKAGGSSLTKVLVRPDPYDDYHVARIESPQIAEAGYTSVPETIQPPKMDETDRVFVDKVEDTLTPPSEARVAQNRPTTELSHEYALKSLGNKFEGPSAGMVIVNRGVVNINQKTYTEPEKTQPTIFGELITQLENLYNRKDLKNLGSLFGGGPKVDVKIKLDMGI